MSKIVTVYSVRECRNSRDTMNVRRCYDPDQTRIGGPLGHRLRRSLQRFLADEVWTPEFVTQDVRRSTVGYRKFSEWHGDISGRHIGLMSIAQQAGEPSDPHLDAIVSKVLAQRLPDGTFGYELDTGSDGSGLSRDSRKKLYGHGRLLNGLAEYYATTRSPEVLETARSIARFVDHSIGPVLRHADRQTQNFLLQALDGVVRLITLCAGEQWPRRLAERIIRSLWKLPDPDPNTPGVHAHAYASTLRGMLDYVYVSGDESVLPVFLQRYDGLFRGVTLDGNYTEVFGYEGMAAKPRNEACGIADWIMIHLRLGAITGDDSHFERAETSLLNALLATQFPNYGFGHRWYLGGDKALGYVTEGEEAWWCCSYHGPRALLDLKRFLFTYDNDRLDVNFLIPSELHTRDLSLRVESDYPVGGTVVVAVTSIAPIRKALGFRIPGFVDRSILAVSVNGEPVTPVFHQGRLVLDRTWQGRDTILVRVPISLRLVDGRTGEPVTDLAPGSVKEECSIAWGPLFLGFSPPAEIALADQMIELSAEQYQQDGSLLLEAFTWRDDGLDSGAALSPGANIYGLLNEGLHRHVTVKSREGTIARGRDLYPENEATRRYCDFRVVFPVRIVG